MRQFSSLTRRFSAGMSLILTSIYRRPSSKMSATDLCISHSTHHVEGFLIDRFESVYVWPKYSVAGVGTQIVSETIEHPNRDSLLRKLRLTPFEPKEWDQLATIGWTFQNYYHRMVDMLPKLWLLQKLISSEPEFRNIPIIIPRDYPQKERPLLEAMAPGASPLVWVSSVRRVKTNSYLHLPQLSTIEAKWHKHHSRMEHLPEEYMQYFQSLATRMFGIGFDGLQKSNPKIFVSRENAKKRRLLNEAEVQKYLIQNGFRVAHLEMLPIDVQARLFNEARTIVCQHGAGLTNLLFAQRHCRVVEILSSGSDPGHFSGYARRIGTYASCMLEPPSRSSRLSVYKKTKDADGYLKIEALKQALSDIE